MLMTVIKKLYTGTCTVEKQKKRNSKLQMSLMVNPGGKAVDKPEAGSCKTRAYDECL